MMEGEQYYDETHIPEDIQIRLRIVAEQATSVRRLRQTTFSSYVSNVASAMKEREIEVENKSIIRKNEESLVTKIWNIPTSKWRYVFYER